MFMYACKIIMYTCKIIMYNHIIFFFTQVKMYVMQWKTYVVMSLQGHRSTSDVSLVYKIPTYPRYLPKECFNFGSLSRGSESLATLTLGSSKINQHYWRFHGSGVIAAPQIIGLISFCTGMHHEYFLRSPMCFRVPHLCSKIPIINNWTGEFATVICCLHCFTVSFGGDVRGESGPR